MRGPDIARKIPRMMKKMSARAMIHQIHPMLKPPPVLLRCVAPPYAPAGCRRSEDS